jgi:hypothetical protein
LIEQCRDVVTDEDAQSNQRKHDSAAEADLHYRLIPSGVPNCLRQKHLRYEIRQLNEESAHDERRNEETPDHQSDEGRRECGWQTPKPCPDQN